MAAKKQIPLLTLPLGALVPLRENFVLAKTKKTLMKSSNNSKFFP